MARLLECELRTLGVRQVNTCYFDTLRLELPVDADVQCGSGRSRPVSTSNTSTIALSAFR